MIQRRWGRCGYEGGREVGKPVDPASHLGCNGQEDWRRAKITKDNAARPGGRGGNWRGEGVETLSTQGRPLDGGKRRKVL